MKKILIKTSLALALMMLGLLTVLIVNMLKFSSKQPKGIRRVTEIFTDENAYERLAAAIRIPTVSFEDRTRCDTLAFLRLHELLRQQYPLTHRVLSRVIINRYSLLYEWKGADTLLKPAILMAHMDVVPVEKESESEWIYPPFEGMVDTEAIWGRGSLDDKSSVMGIMEAIEWLLQRGFSPTRTIYVVFGHDEEIGGEQGARQIAEWLRQRNIQAELVLDEGMFITTGGLVPGIVRPVAMIGVAEKGYLTLELTARTTGGHSSIPPFESSVYILARAIVRLQEHLLEPRLTDPVRQLFEYIGPEMPYRLRILMANMWLFEQLLINEMSRFSEGSAMFRTTIAPTILQSGMKENVVPQEAKGVVNFRLLPGDKAQEIIKKVTKIVRDERISISPLDRTIEASPVADCRHPAFRLLTNTILEVSEDSILITPTLVLGSTDSKHFYDVSPNIFKYLHIRMNADDLKRVHGVNERIRKKDYTELIMFYIQLIRNLQQKQTTS